MLGHTILERIISVMSEASVCVPGARVLRSGSSMFRTKFEAARLGPDLIVSAAARREMDLVSLLVS